MIILPHSHKCNTGVPASSYGRATVDYHHRPQSDQWSSGRPRMRSTRQSSRTGEYGEDHGCGKNSNDIFVDIMLFEIEVFIKCYSEMLKWGDWYDTLKIYVGKKPSSFARCVEIPMMRNLALIYCFSSKGRHLGDNPWAGLGSDKYLVWWNIHRFVCHLHKGDAPSCDSG